MSWYAKDSSWRSEARHTILDPPFLTCPLSVNIDLDHLPVERTLGLWWDCAKDTFMSRFNVQADKKTKRQLLQTLSSIFDPLSFFGSRDTSGQNPLTRSLASKA